MHDTKPKCFIRSQKNHLVLGMFASEQFLITLKTSHTPHTLTH